MNVLSKLRRAFFYRSHSTGLDYRSLFYWYWTKWFPLRSKTTFWIRIRARRHFLSCLFSIARWPVFWPLECDLSVETPCPPNYTRSSLLLHKIKLCSFANLISQKFSDSAAIAVSKHCPKDLSAVKTQSSSIGFLFSYHSAIPEKFFQDYCTCWVWGCIFD